MKLKSRKKKAELRKLKPRKKQRAYKEASSLHICVFMSNNVVMQCHGKSPN